MEVSVIVIAYNEESYIKKCLTAILSQSYSDFELLVVNDCSTDKTESIITAIHDKRIRYISNDKNYSIAESRNIGIKHAKGKHIFFTDVGGGVFDNLFGVLKMPPKRMCDIGLG